jgi:hypothetical protein
MPKNLIVHGASSEILSIPLIQELRITLELLMVNTVLESSSTQYA